MYSMYDENDWLIWQLADSAFPSGSFAHSGGLEAAWQARLVRDRQSLVEFVQAALAQLECGVLRFVLRAWESTEHANTVICPKPAVHGRVIWTVDGDCDLFFNNHVANRASRAQGQALLASAVKTFDLRPLAELHADVRERRLNGHLAPIFGILTRALQIDRERAASLFCFQAVRSYLSSAVRLGIVGPLEAQQIQATFSGHRVITDSDIEPAQTAPLLDLVQGTQDRLYSRLFQS
jgi:urease accessory protein